MIDEIRLENLVRLGIYILFRPYFLIDTIFVIIFSLYVLYDNLSRRKNIIMNKLTPGERVRQLRKHFKLTQLAFSEAIGMTHGNVSKIEKNEVSPTNSFLNAIKIRFSCNPKWIKTGEGEMFISPEEYIADGIKFLGLQKYGQGLKKILRDPQFAELQSIVAIKEMITEDLDPQLIGYLQYILTKWQQGDENIRGWLKIQVEGISVQKK